LKDLVTVGFLKSGKREEEIKRGGGGGGGGISGEKSRHNQYAQSKKICGGTADAHLNGYCFAMEGRGPGLEETATGGLHVRWGEKKLMGRNSFLPVL